MRRIGGTAEWVGRASELATIVAAIEALDRGEGSVVWVEGESGIGKSALVARALESAAAPGDGPGREIGWATADPLSQRVPLRVLQDCLGVRPGTDDPRRAQAAGVLRDGRLGRTAGPPSQGIEELLGLVDKLCADAPLVMVIDDLHWADDSSLIAFHQLAVATGQAPLLLIATSRPAPGRPDVRELRASVERRGAAVIGLGPLPGAEVTELVAAMLGAPPGESLRKITAQGGGNPLYVRELVDALVRDQEVRIGPDTAEVPAALEKLPVPLAAVLEDRLNAVPEETRRTLRTAALLGGTFSVTDLAVLAGRPASALAGSLREAVAAGILADSAPELSFRHPLLRQALYESVPEALRSALHAEGAAGLAARGADPLTVAQQLSMAGLPGAGWTRSWLEAAAPVLILHAPGLAVHLLRREVEARPDLSEAEPGLTVGLVRALLAAGSYDEATRRATGLLREIGDSALRAETYSLLARAQVSVGQSGQAVATLRRALDWAGLPTVWRARILALLAMLERAVPGGLETAGADARRALALAAECGDAFAEAHALLVLWLTHSIRRDHRAALDYIDRALRVHGDDPAHPGLRASAYENRAFTLQNLDRWDEAGQTLQDAAADEKKGKNPARRNWGADAVYRYWTGRWDDALAQLDSGEYEDVPRLTYLYLLEGDFPLLRHGIAALIAGRRDQRTTASRHLRRGLALPAERISDKENRDFLLAARALALEQAGDIRQAVQILADLTRRGEGEMTLRHQWMPYLVRLALAAGDRPAARAAAQACEAEARAETQPARAAAASLRCRGLLKCDPAPLRDVVAYYRETGPPVDLPAALEDLAAVLAEAGAGASAGTGGEARLEEEAREALHEAVSLYESLGAQWDVRRAEGRLRPFGIRRGVRGRRGPRPATGWEALTPTEVRVAAMIGAGRSTSDIADGMFLSRRTVQKHVSNILAKLGAKSRVEIVREVLRQGITE